jgi:hypothetical protein
LETTAATCAGSRRRQQGLASIRLGDALYRQEYFGAFVSTPGSVFDAEVLAHMFGDHTEEEEPEGGVSIVEGRVVERFLQ